MFTAFFLDLFPLISIIIWPNEYLYIFHEKKSRRLHVDHKKGKNCLELLSHFCLEFSGPRKKARVSVRNENGSFHTFVLSCGGWEDTMNGRSY